MKRFCEKETYLHRYLETRSYVCHGVSLSSLPLLRLLCAPENAVSPSLQKKSVAYRKASKQDYVNFV